MEATSDEVEVKNLLVARYLERLNEVRAQAPGDQPQHTGHKAPLEEE